MPRHIACLFAFLATIVLAPGAIAADVKVMISAGFFSVYKELGPAFENSTGHKLVTTRGPSIGDSPEAIPTRLSRGEEADVVIMDGVGVDLLDQRDLARVGSRVPLAESFIGMVVRTGQPKPDISTMDALRKTLLAARSIAFSDSSSGTYFRQSGSRSWALPTRSLARRARCAVLLRASSWLLSSPAGRQKSVSSRSPN